MRGLVRGLDLSPTVARPLDWGPQQEQERMQWAGPLPKKAGTGQAPVRKKWLGTPEARHHQKFGMRGGENLWSYRQHFDFGH